jgi:hypothetical protein
MSYPVAYPYAPTTPLDVLPSPSPVYIILIIGTFLFLASNLMPNLLPVPDRVLCGRLFMTLNSELELTGSPVMSRR